MKTKTFLLMFCLILLSCGSNSHDSGVGSDSQNSIKAKFVLPYPVGKEYICSQGFNNSFSHYGTFSYSIDFDMPIGTLVTAARKGRVIYVIQNYPNSELIAGHENVVIIMHDDTTYSRYSHLTTNGALVKVNQIVMPGDSVGLSGNSGESNHPHLHFDVTKTFTGRNDQTIPFDFINTIPHPFGISSGTKYIALPF
jgi:murein DD-endopeptidase MepM/ murein hydrolase activator NlpD